VKRWRDFSARICGLLAAVFLAATMLITVADVALRAFFNMPVRGVYDLVELFLAYTFFLALPAVFLRDEHILVDIIDNFAARHVLLLKRGAALLAAVLLAAMAWQGWIAARDTYEFNDITADLGLSKVFHWVALLLGVVGAAIAALVMAFSRDEKP
jgi:TRAP-type C4-dicarboxylate transport system permease small subunit